MVEDLIPTSDAFVHQNVNVRAVSCILVVRIVQEVDLGLLLAVCASFKYFALCLTSYMYRQV